MSEVEAQIQKIESESNQTEATCASGSMIYRSWQPWGDQMGGELLVLLHGGSGSWTHWIKNIPVLSDYYELLVPDLPSLGDSATVEKGTKPEAIAELVGTTLRDQVGPRRFHLIAFSWGCVVAALTAPGFAEQVKSILLVGPASTGKPPRASQMQPLISRSSDMSEAEVSAANKENLARLMIFDRRKIDPLAVELQNQNTSRARYNSPRYAMTDLLLNGLSRTPANLLVLYGEQDTVSARFLDWRESQIRSARPDVHFERVPEVGHWLQYEQPEWFNARAVQWIEANIFA